MIVITAIIAIPIIINSLLVKFSKIDKILPNSDGVDELGAEVIGAPPVVRRCVTFGCCCR